jgi:hypothetical protein
MNLENETLYLQQYNALNELKYIINNKINDIKSQETSKLNQINIERQKALKSLERLRNKIDNASNNYISEKISLNDEITQINQKLEKEESDIVKNNQLKAVKAVEDKNLAILDDIKIKQKELHEYDIIKTQHYEVLQNDLFNIKISLKGDKMGWNQRFDFLQGKLNSSLDAFSIFHNKWVEYKENHSNKIADINETIGVLKEELDSSDLNKKIERRDNLRIIHQCLAEKKNFKKQLKQLEDGLLNAQKEKEILVEKQTEWIKIISNEYNLSIDQKKQSILVVEEKVNINSESISSIEKKIKNVELDINRGRNDLINTAWSLRQNLGELRAEQDSLNKEYQQLLIELNNIVKSKNDAINNDPYKKEIEILSQTIEQNQNSINGLTNRQNAQKQKNKFFYEKNKSKLQDIRLEIKNETDNIDKLNLEYQNQQAKYDEERSIRQDKIKSIEMEIQDHHEYLNGLKSQNDSEIKKITDEYDLKMASINDLIKKSQSECNKLKEESNNLLKQKDDLVKKKVVLEKTCKYRLEDITKRLQFIDLEMRQLEILELSYNSEKIKYDSLLLDLTKKEEDVKLFFLPQLTELLQSQIRNNTEIENIKSKLNIT